MPPQYGQSPTTEEETSCRGFGQPAWHRSFTEAIDQPSKGRLTAHIANRMMVSTSERIPFRPDIDTVTTPGSHLHSNILLQKKPLTFHQIDSNVSIKSGPAAILSMYHKFNKSAPNHVQNAAAVHCGTVIASLIKADAAYLVPIAIGRQTLNLEVNTGLDSL